MNRDETISRIYWAERYLDELDDVDLCHRLTSAGNAQLSAWLEALQEICELERRCTQRLNATHCHVCGAFVHALTEIPLPCVCGDCATRGKFAP